MPGIEQRMRALRDVHDVYGSFVVATQGVLIARDLPAVFSNELLTEVGERVALLGEACRNGSETLDECVVRYHEHKLYLRTLSWGVLTVITGQAVNAPALRMAINLVVRHIDPEAAVKRQSSFPPPKATALAPNVHPSASRPVAPNSSRPSVPPSAPPSHEGRDSAPPSQRHVRMYRGRPIADD